ncbi:MAG TPA: hypothetical protein VFT43_08920 [Candidatus Polarisedimenticolia bacterium]|nr:hypothetical protein [Candidatus Polarisedimenticolia bacterium]
MTTAGRHGRLAGVAPVAMPPAVALLLLAGLPPPPASADVPPAAPQDIKQMISDAQKAQAADVAAWRRFRFRRQALRQDLDAHGAVEKSEDLEFRVTPRDDRFDEILQRADGREARPREVARQQHLARFSKHYLTLIAGNGGGDDEESGYSLGHLLKLATYRYVGEETIDGVACHRLDFSPDESKREEGLAGRFAEAMSGSIWITVDGLHMRRARARTVRPISIAFSLSKVHELEVSLDSDSVGEGIWLPRRIEVVARARVLTNAIRRRNVYTYSEFEPVTPEAAPPRL